LTWRLPLLEKLGVDITRGSIRPEALVSTTTATSSSSASKRKRGGTTIKTTTRTSKKATRPPRGKKTKGHHQRSDQEWTDIFDAHERARVKPDFMVMKWCEQRGIVYNTFIHKLRRWEKRGLRQKLGRVKSEEDKEEEEESVEDPKEEDESEEDDDESVGTGEPPKPEDIPKLITCDLCSENPKVVEQALDALDVLAKEDFGNLKTVESLAGHLFILTALRKNTQHGRVVHSALVALYNLVVAPANGQDPVRMVAALRSANAMEAILEALANSLENDQSVLCAFGLLESIIDNSLGMATSFCCTAKVSLELGKHKSHKQETTGLGLMAHYMHKFPIGCVCGHSIWNNDLANNGGCQNCDQQVHVAAMELIKVLEQFPELHDAILASDCWDEMARCIKGTTIPSNATTTDKPPLFLEASQVIKSLLSTSDPSIENDDNDGDSDNNNNNANSNNETPGEQQSPRNPKIKTEPQS